MEMYKVTISADTADLLIRDILIQDYSRTCKSIKHLEESIDDLEPFQIEDLEMYDRVRDALVVMLEYYLPLSEAHEIINKETN